MNILDFCDKISRFKPFAATPFNFKKNTVATDGLVVVFVNPQIPGYSANTHPIPEKELTILYDCVNKFSGSFTPIPILDKNVDSKKCRLACTKHKYIRVVGVCIRYDMLINMSSIKDCMIASDKDGERILFKNNAGVSGVCMGMYVPNERDVLDL